MAQLVFYKKRYSVGPVSLLFGEVPPIIGNNLIFKKLQSTTIPNRLVFNEDNSTGIGNVLGIGSVTVSITTIGSGEKPSTGSGTGNINVDLATVGTGVINIIGQSTNILVVSTTSAGLIESINVGDTTVDLITTGTGIVPISGSGTVSISVSSIGENLSTNFTTNITGVTPFGFVNGVSIAKFDFGNASVVYESYDGGYTFVAVGSSPKLTDSKYHRAFSNAVSYVSIDFDRVTKQLDGPAVVLRGVTGSAPSQSGYATSRTLVSSTPVSSNTLSTYSGTPVGVVYNGTNFVMFVEPDTVLTSTNGSSWTTAGQLNLPGGRTFSSTVTRTGVGAVVNTTQDWGKPWFVNGRWFMVCDNIVYTTTSATPTSGWATCATPTSSDVALSQKVVIDSVVYFQGAYRAFGTLRLATESITNHAAFVSSDGITWTVDYTLGDTSSVDFNQPFILGPSLVSVSDSRLLVTTNGTSWTTSTTSDLLPADMSSGPVYFGPTIGYVSYTSEGTRELRVRDSTTVAQSSFGAAIPNNAHSNIIVQLLTSGVAITPLIAQSAVSVPIGVAGFGVWTGGPEILVESNVLVNVSSTSIGNRFNPIYGLAASTIQIESYGLGNMTYEYNDILGDGGNAYIFIDSAMVGDREDPLESALRPEVTNKNDVFINMVVYVDDMTSNYEIREITSNSEFLNHFRYEKWSTSMVLGTQTKHIETISDSYFDYSSSVVYTQKRYGASIIDLTINISNKYRYIQNEVNMTRLIGKELDKAIGIMATMYELEFE